MFPLKDNIPTDRPAVLTILFIVANVVVYFLAQKGGILSGPDDSITVDWGAIPYEITHPGDHCDELTNGGSLVCEGQDGVTGGPTSQPSTLITVFSSMFMHGSILHLAGNMLFLWIFGNNVEDAMGPAKFVVFYLLGGAAAIGAQTLMEPDAAVPTIGASGAVAAVLGGYALLYPKARVITVIFIIFFFTVVELPAVAILGFWFVQQVLFGAFDLTNPTGGGGGVAYFAHIGGFLFGLIAIKLFASRAKQDYVPT